MQTKIAVLFDNTKFVTKLSEIPDDISFNNYSENILKSLNSSGNLNCLLIGDTVNGYLYFVQHNLLKVFVTAENLNKVNITPSFINQALLNENDSINNDFNEVSLLREHPEMYNFLPINSEVRVKEFFNFIVNVLNINFHPDSTFDEYVDENDKQTIENPLECEWLDTLMSVCFEICGNSVYDLGFEILKKRTYSPAKNQVDGDDTTKIEEWQKEEIRVTIENYFKNNSTILQTEFLNLANVVNSQGLNLPSKFDEETANTIMEFTKGKPLFAESILSLTETLYNYYKSKFGGNVSDDIKQFTEKLSYQQLLKVDYLHPHQYELIKDDEKFKTSHWNFDSVRNLYIRKENNEIENQRKDSPYQRDKKMSQQMKDRNILGHKVFDDKTNVNVLTPELIKFLDVNELTEEELKDVEYVSSIVLNYNDYFDLPVDITEEESEKIAEAYIELKKNNKIAPISGYGNGFELFTHDTFVFENRDDFDKSFNNVSKKDGFIDASHSELIISLETNSNLYKYFVGKFKRIDEDDNEIPMENPIINFEEIEVDERAPKRKNNYKTYNVNYQITDDDEEYEIEGVFNTDKSEFQASDYSSDEAENYFDNNWEEINEQIEAEYLKFAKK